MNCTSFESNNWTVRWYFVHCIFFRKIKVPSDEKWCLLLINMHDLKKEDRLQSKMLITILIFNDSHPHFTICITIFFIWIHRNIRHTFIALESSKFFPSTVKLLLHILFTIFWAINHNVQNIVINILLKEIKILHKIYFFLIFVTLW